MYSGKVMNRSSTSGGLHHLSEFEEVGRQFQERLVQFHVLQNIDVLFHCTSGSNYGSCSFDQF